MSSDPFELTGSTAVVTGAAGEVGLAVTKALVSRGACVLAFDLNEDIEGVAAQAGATGVRVDVCDEDTVSREIAARAANGVDILVNNAGINDRVEPFHVEMATWDRIMDVNLRGYFIVARQVARHQIAIGKPAAIVNVSSTAATTSLGRGNLVYGLSKAGVNQLTRELAIQWAASGIRVNAVQPAQIDTAAWRAASREPSMASTYRRVLAGIPMGRLIRPDELVGPILFLATQVSSAITGAVLPIDGGNLALNASGSIAAAMVASDLEAANP